MSSDKNDRLQPPCAKGDPPSATAAHDIDLSNMHLSIAVQRRSLPQLAAVLLFATIPTESFGQTPPPRWRFGSITDSRHASELLREVAENYSSDDIDSEPRLSLAGNSLTYNLLLDPSLPAPDSSEVDDRLTRPLQQILRLAEIRRDLLRTKMQTPAILGSLKDAEESTAAMVDLAYHAAAVGDWVTRRQALESHIDRSLAHLETQLVDLAQKQHLTILKKREGPQGFKVNIAVDPPIARVRFMPLLKYRLATAFGEPLDNQWVILNPGPQQLLGRYFYRAEWPDDLNGTEEGIFDIRSASSVTFKPKATK